MAVSSACGGAAAMTVALAAAAGNGNRPRKQEGRRQHGGLSEVKAPAADPTEEIAKLAERPGPERQLLLLPAPAAGGLLQAAQPAVHAAANVPAGVEGPLVTFVDGVTEAGDAHAAQTADDGGGDEMLKIDVFQFFLCQRVPLRSDENVRLTGINGFLGV